MIREISFKKIKFYWDAYLWRERCLDGISVAEVNLETQHDYINPKMKLDPTYIAYYDRDKIVGVESGYKTSPFYYRIRGLWVHDKYRRKGIATEMVNYFKQKASDCIFLWSIPRESALPFYTSNGFNITGVCSDTIYGTTYFVRRVL